MTAPRTATLAALGVLVGGFRVAIAPSTRLSLPLSAAVRTSRTTLLRCSRCCFIFGTIAYTFGQRHLFYLFFQETLNLLEVINVLVADKCNGNAIAFGTCRSANAVHIVFNIVRNIIVYHHRNIVDINAARQYIGCNEHVGCATLELEHHLVAFLLRKVRVHFVAVYLHSHQGTVDLLYLLFLAREDNHAVKVACLKDVFKHFKFLRLVTKVGFLRYFLGRLAHCELNFNGIFQQSLGQLLYFRRDGGREHDGLATVGG